MRDDLLSPATVRRLTLEELGDRTDPEAVVQRLLYRTDELVDAGFGVLASYERDAVDIAAAHSRGLTVQQYRDRVDEALADFELSVG